MGVAEYANLPNRVGTDNIPTGLPSSLPFRARHAVAQLIIKLGNFTLSAKHFTYINQSTNNIYIYLEICLLFNCCAFRSNFAPTSFGTLFLALYLWQ